MFIAKKAVTTLCDNAVAQYNFNANQQILVIFGRNVAKGVCYDCYQMVISYPTSPN